MDIGTTRGEIDYVASNGESTREASVPPDERLISSTVRMGIDSDTTRRIIAQRPTSGMGQYSIVGTWANHIRFAPVVSTGRRNTLS